MAYKTPSKTSEFIRSLLKKEQDPLLAEIIHEADNARIPILLPEAAAFAAQLVKLSRPSRILEIGTAIGYSGCLFLRNSDCTLTTIDKDAKSLLRANYYFTKAGFCGRFNIIEGDADEVIPKLNDDYDFIFLDGPKSKYINYLPYLKKLLSKGGVLLADNVLFNGMVADKDLLDPKKRTIVTNLELFLKAICDDSDFETSIVDVGDGMSISIKL